MIHDLLKLAEECETKLIGLAVIRAVAPQLGNTCDELTLTLSKIYAAIRAAHEELEYFRAFRDELQAANTKLTLENRELRELVKRHEDALEWVSASKNHMKKSEGDSRGMFESWHGVGALSATHLNKRFANSPLAAIEAAMKEEQIENPPLTAWGRARRRHCP